LDKLNGNGPGRPKSENPKVHLPRVKCYKNSLEEMEKIAKRKKRSLSDVYQEALDMYIRAENQRGLSVTL
jgi:hypothetical protein